MKSFLNERKAVVITPTVGTLYLRDAVESVCKQTYHNTLHLVVVDGEIFRERTQLALQDLDLKNLTQIVLPSNTGIGFQGMKFNGHRIYAAVPFLVNADYILFLDEDNWFDIDHVSSLVSLIEEQNLEWAYSLRKIYEEDKQFVGMDNCENLGRWPPFSGRSNLVDTSCYCFRSDVLSRICHYWFHPLGADRYFYMKISKEFQKFETNGRYTLNYRLNSSRPPSSKFFLSGNEYMLKKFRGNLPWVN